MITENSDKKYKNKNNDDNNNNNNNNKALWIIKYFGKTSKALHQKKIKFLGFVYSTTCTIIRINVIIFCKFDYNELSQL